MCFIPLDMVLATRCLAADHDAARHRDFVLLFLMRITFLGSDAMPLPVLQYCAGRLNPYSESHLYGHIREGYFFGEFFPVFFGIFFPFSGGRKVRGRKEGMGEGSKKQIGIKKTNKDQKKQIRIKKTNLKTKGGEGRKEGRKKEVTFS